MDAFSYLSVLLSIILGLAITQLLQGVGRLIQARERVSFFWVPLVLASVLLVSLIQSWWAMFGLRTRASWDFLGFSVVILQTVFSYLQAAVIMPEVPAEAAVDLRAGYFAHARWFFAFVILGTLTSLLKDLVLDGHLPEPLNVGFHCFWIVLALGAMATRRPWYHKLAAITAAVMIPLYILLLFTRLR